MINPMNLGGDLQKLQQQAQQMKAELEKEVVEIEKNGVRVKVRGDQEIMEIEVDGILENRIANAINDAVKKTQEIAARKLISMNQ